MVGPNPSMKYVGNCEWKMGSHMCGSLVPHWEISDIEVGLY